MHDRITDLLELAGLLLLSAAGAVFVARWSLPGGLAVGGLLLLLSSALIVARTPKPKPSNEQSTA